MSIVFQSNCGFFISHEKFIAKCYQNVIENNESRGFALNESLFKIKSAYKTKLQESRLKKKRKVSETKDNYHKVLEEINFVKKQHQILREELLKAGICKEHSQSETCDNKDALDIAEKVYNETGQSLIRNAFGANEIASIRTFDSQMYLFPENCRFFCKDVKEINSYLKNNKFDVIILDPPWWNKYIRRKKAKTDHGYQMLHIKDIGTIPVGDLLADDGLLVIWCTNSQQQINTLLCDVFNKWGVKFLSKWFWVKVTEGGETVCPFSEPDGKQPFEQILFASPLKQRENTPPNHKIVCSIPSSLHSHKPPLLELIKPYVTEDSSCLEIFARYLLPNCTSYGLEALRFQHISLYEAKERAIQN